MHARTAKAGVWLLTTTEMRMEISRRAPWKRLASCFFLAKEDWRESVCFTAGPLGFLCFGGVPADSAEANCL
jgi:hypothetical protein